MSEPKVVKQSDVLWGHWFTEYYLKSEADKVIAELKKERDWLAKDRALAYDDLEKRVQLNIKQEESIRHQKYKRCLAMAEFALKKARNFEKIEAFATRHNFSSADRYRIKKERKYSHYMKWLELADKLKDDKRVKKLGF